MEQTKTPSNIKPTTPKQTRKTKRIGLSPLDEHRLRRALSRSAPSQPWVDAQIISVQDTTPDGEPIRYRFFDANVFPPGGKNQTPMRWCRSCGRYTPAPCIRLVEHRLSRTSEIHSATLQCDDCWLGIESEIFRELHEAGLFLRPSGSMSFIRMGDRKHDRLHG